MRSVSVIVAGGGPVGLTLARDLARRGVPCLLVEKGAATTRHPKMDNTNVRSMELFSQSGLEYRLRGIAVPEDHPFDVSWVTTMTGHELKRFAYPSPAQERERYWERNDGAQPYAPPMRASQVEIEPLLKTAAEEEALAGVRFGVALIDLLEDEEGVTATLQDQHSGMTEQVRCSYLVGCDGGTSTVRAALGIRATGEPANMPRFTTHFRTHDPETRKLLQRWGVTWRYQSVHGTLIAHNDKDLWTLQTSHSADEVVTTDPKALVARFVGRDIPIEVLAAKPWTSHQMVADRAGTQRVFLAGDAAHQYMSVVYSMSTGIADACTLGWMLAARLRCFGGPNLLRAYQRERQPVWLRNCEGTRKHNAARIHIAGLYKSILEKHGSDGEAERETISTEIELIGNAENESLGLELGYHYSGSPLVAKEMSATVPVDPDRYEPTTLPGARLPSLFLSDGSAVFAALGRWFTLLVFGDFDIWHWQKIACKQGMPLKIVRIKDDHARAIYGADLLLVRPDQHVAWRGLKSTNIGQAKAVLRMALGWARA